MITKLKRAGVITATSSPYEHSAYCCFSLHTQCELKKKLGPDANVDEISKEIERRWSNELDSNERKRWERLAEIKTQQKRAPVFKNRKLVINNVSPRKKAKVNKKVKDKKSSQKADNDIEKKRLDDGSSKPKRPMTAYLFFAQEMRPKIKQLHPEYPGITVTKEIGVMWQNMSVYAKLNYKRLEIEARKEYMTSLKKWKDKCDVNTHEASVISQASTSTSSSTCSSIGSSVGSSTSIGNADKEASFSKYSPCDSISFRVNQSKIIDEKLYLAKIMKNDIAISNNSHQPP